MKSDRQDLVKALISKSGLSKAFVARKVGLTPQNFIYHLNESPELDFDLFLQVLQTLEKFGGEESKSEVLKELNNIAGLNQKDQKSDSKADNGDKSINSRMQQAIEEFNNSNVLKEFKIPLLGMAPAGVNDFIPFIDAQLTTVSLDSRTQFAVMVNSNLGASMTPLLKPGDIVFCATTQKVSDGDLALCRWRNEAAIKMVSLNPEGLPDMVILHSYNPTGPTLVVPQKEIRMYPIIFIRKFPAKNGDK